jgi:hypothetical protein
MIHMPSLTGYLIDTNVDKATEISVCQTIVNNILNGFTDCIPMETKELTNNLPGHQFGPRSQDHTQMKRERAFPLRPGHRFHPNPTVTTFDSSGRIDQGDRNSPERHMLPLSFLQRVVSRSFLSTRGTYDFTSSIGNQIDHHFTVFLSNLFDTMSLESQGLSDYTFNEHESYPPFPIGSSPTGTIGFDSCFQVFK